MATWAFLRHLDTPVVAFLGLGTVVLLILGHNGFAWAWDRRGSKKITVICDCHVAGVKLLNAPVEQHNLLDWLIRVDAWTDKTYAALLKYCGRAKADYFKILTFYNPDEQMVGSLNIGHNQKRVMLTHRLKRLEEIRDEPGRA